MLHDHKIQLHRVVVRFDARQATPGMNNLHRTTIPNLMLKTKTVLINEQ